jgi:hypothetical protein
MKSRQMVFLTALVVALLTLYSAPLFAHHGAAAYDMAHTITAKATVTSVTWINPHTVLNFDVKDDSGKVIHWQAEMYNPLYMVRSGWTKDTLKNGDEITVTFNPAKNGSPNGLIRENVSKIVFNGQELGLTQR